jgi:hypothetical protein
MFFIHVVIAKDSIQKGYEWEESTDSIKERVRSRSVKASREAGNQLVFHQSNSISTVILRRSMHISDHFRKEEPMSSSLFWTIFR